MEVPLVSGELRLRSLSLQHCHGATHTDTPREPTLTKTTPEPIVMLVANGQKCPLTLPKDTQVCLY